MSDSIAILIPAYNPEDHLIRLVSDLKHSGFSKIVIVDDGSECSKIIDRSAINVSADVVRHTQNMGKGAALKSGFKFISEKYSNEVQTIITVDADGQHLSADVIRIAKGASKAPQNLILGVRDFKRAVPMRSALGNSLTKVVLRLVKNISLSDTQTELRAIPLDFANESCEIPSNHYEFELKSILLADGRGITIEELPITTLYIDNNQSSHFRPIVDSMRVYAVFARFISVSLVSFMIDITVFAILYTVSSNVYTSTYIARAISATLNFLGNKFFVFKSRHKTRAIFEACGYVALVILVASVSAYFVSLIQVETALNIIFIKILVDILLFFVSFSIQRYLLFNPR